MLLIHIPKLSYSIYWFLFGISVLNHWMLFPRQSISYLPYFLYYNNDSSIFLKACRKLFKILFLQYQVSSHILQDLSKVHLSKVKFHHLYILFICPKFSSCCLCALLEIFMCFFIFFHLLVHRDHEKFE